jgi:hypothetical protein
LVGLDQPECCSGWVLIEHIRTDGSPAQALSNQCTGWCCIDRLSWQRLSGMWIRSGPRHLVIAASEI